MGEKHSLLSQKSFFCLFSFSSVLFILSWFFLLRCPHTMGTNFLLSSKPFTIIENLYNEPLPPPPILPSPNLNNNIRPSVLNANSKGESMDNCNLDKQVLKIFMYDLPVEFHFGILDWKPKENIIWPDISTQVPNYPGGLNLQHSIEYWLTLDLLASEFSSSSSIFRSSIRVGNSSEADLIFVPFFSSLSYNHDSKSNPDQKKSRNKFLQAKLVRYLTAQEEWKRYGGIDHIILAHHPNSLMDARTKLWPAMFILSDFGRYPPNIANVDKDVIAPYKHVVTSFVNDFSDFNSRTTLLYFQGAIYRKDGGFVRQELYYLLKDEKDIHFSFGNVQGHGIRDASRGMQMSKFCLNIAGDTPSSNRLFDAIASHCVPVIISDEIELPYEDVLDYSRFCLFVRTSEALKPGFLINLVKRVKREEWSKMWARLKEVENFFEFRYPSKEGDAVQMIWQAVARKVPSIRMRIHKLKRYASPVTTQKLRIMTIPRKFLS